MSEHPDQIRFLDLVDEAVELQFTKQEQYGSSDDPFSNYRQAEAWGEPAWVAAMVRVDDKLARLRSLAQGNEMDHDAVRDAFLDIAVGALNARILWEDQHPEVPDLPVVIDLGQVVRQVQVHLQSMAARAQALREHEEHTHMAFTPPFDENAKPFPQDEESDPPDGENVRDFDGEAVPPSWDDNGGAQSQKENA